MSSTISKFFYLPLSAMFLSASISTQATDLAEVYALAVENDHEFKAARAGYLASAEVKKLSRSGLLPKINGEASWSDSEDDNSGIRISPSSTDTNLVSETTDTTTTGYSISLNQPLFDMSAWNDFKAGNANASAAKANYHSSQQALIIRSSQAYFDALLAASNLETSRAQEDALHHQLMQTKQRFDVGLSAITEVHEAQAAYDSSVAERLIAEGRLGIAFEAIEVITGRPFEELSSLKADFPASAPQPMAREAWVERALENNYELLSSKLSSDASKYSAKSAKSGHYPTLTLSGTYSNQERDSETNPTNLSDIETDTKRIGLTLNVPIYNGGSVSATRRQAKQQALKRYYWRIHSEGASTGHCFTRKCA